MAAASGAGACAGRGERYSPVHMSASEIIELIKKLPPEERAEVREYLGTKEEIVAADGIRRMDFAQGLSIGQGIFERHPELFRKLAQ